MPQHGRWKNEQADLGGCGERDLARDHLENGELAHNLYGDFTHLHVDPTGKFIISGTQGDAALTGCKIIFDTSAAGAP